MPTSPPLSEAIDGDQTASWLTRHFIIISGALGIITYLVGLFVFAPATWIVESLPETLTPIATEGHAQDGKIVLANGLALEWHLNSLASIVAFSVKGDWRISGAATDLQGLFRVNTSTTEIDNIEGVIGHEKLSIVIPDLMKHCTFDLRLNIAKMRLTRGTVHARGTAQSGPVTCGTDEHPSLRLHIEETPDGSRFDITETSNPTSIPLVTGKIGLNRTLVAELSSKGAERFLNQSSRLPLTFEYAW